MTEYKHITFNTMQKLEWALNQVDESWKLESVVPYSLYESIAVFSRIAPSQTLAKEKESN